MAQGDGRRGLRDGYRRRRKTLVSMLVSFLDLFDKATRTLIVACMVLSVVSVVVICGHASYISDSGEALILQSAWGRGESASPETGAASAERHGDKRAGSVPDGDSSADASGEPSWMLPSGGAYVDLSGVPDLNVDVSLADQRVYVRSGDTVIYTMICSTGLDGSTPAGDYTVQNRGETFFNPDENMGGNYWVSWANYGEYLFHTVPTDANGDYIVQEAEKLGVPASHGCVRLTVADAKWLYEQLPTGTPVHIG